MNSRGLHLWLMTRWGSTTDFVFNAPAINGDKANFLIYQSAFQRILRVLQVNILSLLVESHFDFSDTLKHNYRLFEPVLETTHLQFLMLRSLKNNFNFYKAINADSCKPLTQEVISPHLFKICHALMRICKKAKSKKYWVKIKPLSSSLLWHSAELGSSHCGR